MERSEVRQLVTLFDAKHLAHGLALYDSLDLHYSEDFILNVLAMDAECYRILDAMAIPNMRVFTLESVEIAMCLKPVRDSRTWAEFCWTMASNFTWLISSLPDVKDVTYLDADLFFFGDPRVIFDEIGSASIGILPHHFSDQYQFQEVNGKFCVSIVHFKNNHFGKECLRDWAADCRNWCYHRNEPGRFGDQKYLDVWPGKYGAECHVIESRGVSLAPWNMGTPYLFAPDKNGVVWGHIEVTSGESKEFIEKHYVSVTAFHFHGCREINGQMQLTNGHEVRKDHYECLYEPYLRALEEAKERIRSVA